MRCQCTSNNRITPTWSFSDGSIITACNNSQHFEICSNISKKSPQILSFSLLSEEFSGVYKCHTKTITKLFKLFAFGQCCQICMLLLNCIHAGPPVIQQLIRQKPLLPVVGGTTLHCRAAGYGSLMYLWETNITGSWKAVSNKNRTHYIASSAGQYRCNVTNEAGSVVSNVATVFGENILNHGHFIVMKLVINYFVSSHQVLLVFLFIQSVVLWLLVQPSLCTVT